MYSNCRQRKMSLLHIALLATLLSPILSSPGSGSGSEPNSGGCNIDCNNIAQLFLGPEYESYLSQISFCQDG